MAGENTLLRDINELLPVYRNEVIDFVAYLKSKQERQSPRILTPEEFEAGVECPLDHTPNTETIASFNETDKKRFTDTGELFDYLHNLVNEAGIKTYSIDEEKREITFERIGTHSDLF